MFLNKKNCKKHKKCKFRKISKELILEISAQKKEPKWMLDRRLEAYKLYKKAKKPTWGPNLEDLDLDNLCYFVKSDFVQNNNWNKIPYNIRDTFDKIGVNKDNNFFSGIGAQFDSNSVFHNLKEKYEKKGIIFENMDVAVKKYPNLVKKYFMRKCVNPNLHIFSLLHACVWSGGTFIYVPKGVIVDEPMQAYFRINQEKFGQFEHTIIVAEPGSQIEYIEGCSAPEYKKNSLHCGCVELFVKKDAKIIYSSIENWSLDIFNLNTKRAIVDERGVVEWVSCNTGSNTTMLYPTSVLVGDYSKSFNYGVSKSCFNQNQDIGNKVFHVGCNTKSVIVSKSICQNGGISTYRGLVDVSKNAKNSKSTIDCDALVLDDKSVSNTYPLIDVRNSSSTIVHEAKVGRINESLIFYLMAKGICEKDAKNIIVNGFLNPIAKKFPLDYAVEFNKLIDLDFDGF